jgi:hypothetical protein
LLLKFDVYRLIDLESIPLTGDDGARRDISPVVSDQLADPRRVLARSAKRIEEGLITIVEVLTTDFEVVVTLSLVSQQ